MSERDYHRLSQLLRALANPYRLAILQRLQVDGRCCRRDRAGNTVCAIAAELPLALSTVSHHLKALRAAGLITCERRGTQVLCTVDQEALAPLRRLLSSQRRRRGQRAAPARRRAGRAAH